jgi:cyclopropane fatty-acyl-phospholipid synthase-like methyltransferase
MPVGPLIVAVALAVVAAALAYFVFASFLFGAGYQPTPRASALMMLKLAALTPEDMLYDLGAGTGALVFRATRLYGARAVGVEVEPIRVLVLRLRRRLSGASDRLTVRWGNMYDLDFGRATVVAAFLWPGAMARLRPKFEAELRPGARVVSHCHPVPGWTPEVHDRATDVYLYRWPGAASPASAGGVKGGA